MNDVRAQMLEDRYLRDAAKALVEADVERLKTGLSQKSIGARVGDRVKDTALDVFDEAKDVAEENKGLLTAIVAALVIWLARHPILSFLGLEDDDDEDEDDDDHRSDKHMTKDDE